MGRITPLPEGTVEQLAPLLKKAHSQAEYQRLQCVWLRAALQMNAAAIALALGWHPDAVRHVQARYRRGGVEALRDRPQGGRRHQNLTADEEKELLAPFLDKAQVGELAVAAPVRHAYEQRLGRAVHPSVVYRALHRAGWRKLAPRPQHPQADPEAQEAFKKSCPRSSSTR